MTTNSDSFSGPTRAIADFAFGGRTGVVDVSRPLAWLSPEEMEIDLADPVARRFGDYELLEKIGQGGMGVVYRARQHGLERDVAVKLLSAGPWASEEFIARFRREARSAARMQHPNIVEIYEFGHRDGLNYFSMRLIEGRTLAQKLAGDGPLPARDAAALLRLLAEAMDYAHRLGVLHLDLKPANVLLTKDGVPLIADFGLARRIDAGHDGATEISGTPSYMAPEQATLESHPLSASTDIYGLGAVLYECLTGRAPFLGSDARAVLERVATEAPVAPRALRRGVPLDLDAICLKCLEKDPARRYAGARAFADDLGRFLDGRAVSVRPLGLRERMRRWLQREPRLAAALGVALLTLLVGASTTAWQWRDAVAQRMVAEASERSATAERDRARIASEIGAYLYVHGGDAEDSEELAHGLIEWLRKRWPGDEEKQADALAAFTGSIGSEDRNRADQLLSTIIMVLGTDYRRKVIDALQAGRDPRRNLHSAVLAWSGDRTDVTGGNFKKYLEAAISDDPGDARTWQVAAVYCLDVGGRRRCLHPEATERLVAIAPDNMYHWLLLSMAATDPARSREALREAARQNDVNDHLGENYRAYAQAFAEAGVRAPSLLARPALVLAPDERPESTLAIATAGTVPIVSWQPLLRDCLPPDLATLPADLRSDCLTVGVRMARSDNGLLTRMTGVAIARNLAMGTPLAEEMKQVRVLYQYLHSVEETLSPRQRLSYPAKRLFDDMIHAGEMVAMQRRAVYFGKPATPPAHWKPVDPNSLLTAREVLERLTSVIERGTQLVATGQHAEAVAVLAPAEAEVREWMGRRSPWQIPKLLLLLGNARVGLGEFAAAEANLLDAWDFVQQFGPSSPEGRDGARSIVALYAAWNEAEPGKGYDGKATEWQRTVDELQAAARR